MPSAGPTTTLPATASRNVGATVAIENAVGGDARRRRGDRSATRCASFSRLSPSRIVRMRCGGLQLPQHRGRRRGVRRRDDRAERNQPVAHGIAGHQAREQRTRRPTVVRPTATHDKAGERAPSCL